MAGFQISESDDRLTLTMPVDGRRVAVGCAGFGATFVCLLLLGLAGIWMDLNSPDQGPHVVESFIDPSRNHFGFLWLVGLALLTGLVPFYVWRVSRSGVVLVFDRGEGLLRRNDVPVCRLVRIEFVRLAAVRDVAGQRLFRASILHDDGCELRVDESPDVDVVRNSAAAIADFLGVELQTR